MREEKGQIKGSFRRANQAFQAACAALLMVTGGLLLATLILQAPELFQSLLEGDTAAVDSIISSAAGVGICWLQWQYRHVVYPQLRRDHHSAKARARVSDIPARSTD